MIKECKSGFDQEFCFFFVNTVKEFCQRIGVENPVSFVQAIILSQIANDLVDVKCDPDKSFLQQEYEMFMRDTKNYQDAFEKAFNNYLGSEKWIAENWDKIIEKHRIK